MTTCANCSNEAVFQYNILENLTIYYCGTHLPKFLKGKSSASLLVSKVEEPAPVSKKKSTKKEPEPVVEEPVIEEPVVDESTEETVEETDGTD